MRAATTLAGSATAGAGGADVGALLLGRAHGVITSTGRAVSGSLLSSLVRSLVVEFQNSRSCRWLCFVVSVLLSRCLSPMAKLVLAAAPSSDEVSVESSASMAIERHGSNIGKC